MKGLTLAIAAAGLIGLAACAPRIQNTHYERWAAQDAKRKADAAAAAKAETSASKTPPAAPKKATQAPVATPPPPPPGEAYNSLSGETPPVKTATKTRAVKPAEEDDIY